MPNNSQPTVYVWEFLSFTFWGCLGFARLGYVGLLLGSVATHHCGGVWKNACLSGASKIRFESHSCITQMLFSAGCIESSHWLGFHDERTKGTNLSWSIVDLGKKIVAPLAVHYRLLSSEAGSDYSVSVFYSIQTNRTNRTQFWRWAAIHQAIAGCIATCLDRNFEREQSENRITAMDCSELFMTRLK